MSWDLRGKTISLKATNISAKYKPVKVTAAETFDLCSAGQAATGFLQNSVGAGEVGAVMVDGVTFAIASAPIAAGAKVAAAGSGKIRTVQGGDVALGTALNPAGADGDIISVLLQIANVGPIGSTGVEGPQGQVIYASVGANLAAGADIAGQVIIAIPHGYTAALLDAKVISAGAAGGVDDANTSVFAVKTGATALAGFTFDTDNAFPGAGLLQTFDLEVGAAGPIAQDAVIVFDCTNGATADLPAFTVQITLELTEI